MSAQVRSFSYGGGVQSTAALVLAATGEIDYPVFCFANVGEDSEHPATLAYVNDVAAPYAQRHGIELVQLRKTLRDGTTQTLRERIDASERSIPIPVRMGPDGAPGRPFHSAEEWRQLARKTPQLFQSACDLEQTLHERGQRLGRGEFYFTRHGAPLSAVIDTQQTALFDDDNCESGYCFT